MKNSLKFSLATLLLLNPYCDKSPSPRKPTSSSQISEPETQIGVVPCYVNDESRLGILVFNNQEVLYTRGSTKKEPLVVHGYKSSEKKIAESGSKFYNVSYIINRNAISEIEKDLRDKGYDGKITFWKLP